MSKLAYISIFVASVFLVGAMGVFAESLPDLMVTDVAYSSGVVSIIVENKGTADISISDDSIFSEITAPIPKPNPPGIINNCVLNGSQSNPTPYCREANGRHICSQVWGGKCAKVTYGQKSSCVCKRGGYNIAAGQSAVVKYDIEPLESGKYDIKVALDPENKIAEINENNNEFTKKITVGPLKVATKMPLRKSSVKPGVFAGLLAFFGVK